MIKFTTGDLLLAPAEALVNAVNTAGVMGKGIALQFKKRFPQNYNLYKQAAEAGQLETGKNFVVQNPTTDPVKWIINFPTKKHWRSPSELEYVVAGLDDLRNVIKDLKIKSIALPALGCGNGGLDWNIVKPILENKLECLVEVEILIYEPI
ncbi:O-acetyl-ADP-ribose deacetylase (regulator of RNase III) [Chitinophaga terrae (ex Kim and Jung 2007)]|uniref:macro domain-containing protein n=1 Tax=Chitinophaga terrae (ex Kim and Jung 2007) TaxID=408074 RepID=UPI002785195D|nr:macro domain-containing protein [Chitinophaga terrae (ex Kim and Jung 2007)]MDQ0109847.1 O-acetyl-ADP-ribose deacetylase (regulator of RNase III) [Chitinophaga terrae (ex Kim and Jung 2007)]